MLAVIAAMIRIASSPSRKTIIAAFVITVASLAPSPVFARASSSASSRTSRVSRISATGRAVGDQLGEAVDAACAVPHQPLDLGDQCGVERPELDLGAELEEGVGAQARLLRLLALGRRRSAASIWSRLMSIRSKSASSSDSFHSSGKTRVEVSLASA